jgi:hypothetical protein
VLRIPLAERLGDEVLVGERHHRHPDSGHPPELGRVHAAGVDDDLGLDSTNGFAVGARRLRPHARHPPALHIDALDPRVREDPAAAAARPVGQRVREL